MTNWREYNEALVRRGDVTLWFSEEVVDAWEHANREGKNGRPFLYSDLAIETLLTLRPPRADSACPTARPRVLGGRSRS